MMIQLTAYNKNPNIGVIGRANDKIALLPSGCSKNFALMAEETLGVEIYNTNISGTSLVGSMIAMNNNGILLPRHASGEEIKKLGKLGLNIGVLKDKLTALGNLILLNDYGAVIGKGFSRHNISIMRDTFECEIETCKIKEFKTLGSIGIATNKGALIHPAVDEEELRLIEGVLRVSADVGTVNRGVGFVRTGIIANTKGALVGNETTGPEIARIVDSLGFL